MRRLAPLMLVSSALGAPGSPAVHGVEPAGVQRGTAFSLTLTGERLQGARQVLLYDPGLTVTGVANTNDTTVVVTGTATPECATGEHRLRLVTAGGVSELRTVWVGAWPVVAEVEPNGDLASAQKVPLNCTVSGVVTREDADYYAVEVKAGERITAGHEKRRNSRRLGSAGPSTCQVETLVVEAPR